jgi:6-pyruvoyltetrahydropterin/6-carboxytetrahydropterin synthase
MLAEQNPYLQILARDDNEIEFRLCGRRYVLPAEDVIILDVDNVTVENLSVVFANQMVGRLGETLTRDVVEGIEVQVLEIRGQGGTFYWRWFE